MAKHDKPENVLAAPEEVLSTMNQDGSRRWIYPKLSQGVWLKRRKLVGWALIVLFFGTPWVRIGGEPALLLDVVHRRFSILGQVFYATDTALLMLLGITLVFGVVWMTALFGRVWCGWGCPQTVYMEFVFRPIDRLIEGTERERSKLAEREWDADKIKRKSAKYAIYTAIAAAMSHTFVAYFVGWEALQAWMFGPPSEHWPFFLLMGGTTALVVFDFAYFREQMCTIACPYARLQSVLLDKDSMIVSYDAGRGEARGAPKARLSAEAKAGLGDCIDCGACVRTCPTGIDIRNGLQLECLGCTQCIDACDAIMIKMDRPVGLIRYTSENALAGSPARILRPRVLVYTGLMMLFSGMLAFGWARTGGLDVDVIRATGAPFVMLPDGTVANRVKARMQNRGAQARDVQMTISEPEGATLRLVGADSVTLKPGQMKRVEAWIIVPRAAFEGGQSSAKLSFGDGEDTEVMDFALVGPEGPARGE